MNYKGQQSIAQKKLVREYETKWEKQAKQAALIAGVFFVSLLSTI